MQDDQTITNMTTSAPLGKSHHKVLSFHYTVDNSKNIIKRWKTELTIGSWKRKTNTITKCTAKYINQSKTLAEKQLYIDYRKSLSREVKSNPKAFFRYAKNKLNFKNAIPDLVDNGKILSDDTSKAKVFNMFFISILQRNQIVFQILI